MVDSAQGPAGQPEKPVEAVVVTDPLERLRRPPEFLTMDGLSECLPAFLVLCGLLASAVLFLDGFDWLMDHPRDTTGHQGGYLIGLSFFVGPLLFGIAGILYRLNQRKRD